MKTLGHRSFIFLLTKFQWLKEKLVTDSLLPATRIFEILAQIQTSTLLISNAKGQLNSWIIYRFFYPHAASRFSLLV